MNKHAYMIMAHHRPDLLQLLINSLDDERNDIIVHIDKKSNMKPEQFETQYAKIFFINQMSVNWAGYTQIQCEYELMKHAAAIGHHAYYHFLTGANYPLWNQNYIYDFFEKNKGYEFIGFDNAIDYSIRVKYYIPFSEHGKLRGVSGHLIEGVREFAKLVQKVLHVNRIKNQNLIIKKGCAYFSITEGMLLEILKQEKKVKDMYVHTICCDEVFVQTIAYNSEFRNKIYNLENEYDGCLRELAWPSNISGIHPGWNFSQKDLEYLLNSKRLFAMKFEASDSIDVIQAIKQKRDIQ
ncbi:beta-1,6-N-acetylglucosaminyltransferase [Roseburia inulinivorans]|jgi:hypothetical protein|uniref:Peptide O-xylosyltransferase n=1 Tax=Roseburia inulinivorans TaxID=360807 RepID=A0A412FHT5_9FIRM|nr:beta-1,6-N-acetylglucosaminyltransferase [Roseburia inulinivorans]RGR67724.1 hypothetical protein DWY29_10195 [Roseburia inulinivorans]